MADFIDLTGDTLTRPNKRLRRSISTADDEVTIVSVTPAAPSTRRPRGKEHCYAVKPARTSDVAAAGAAAAASRSLPTGSYQLDACSCKHIQQELADALIALSQPDELPINLSELVPLFKCPSCHQGISYRDLYRLMGPLHTQRMLSAVAAAAERQANARNRNASIACTSCCIPLIWVEPPSEEHTPTLPQLKAALQQHQGAGTCKQCKDVAAGLSALTAALPKAVRCCTQCPVWQDRASGEVVQDNSSRATVDHPAGRKALDLQRLCYNLRDALRSELAETKKDAAAANPIGKIAGGFVKGTGYGGGSQEDGTAAFVKRLEAAKQRQAASDRLCTKLVNNIVKTLEAAAASSNLVVGLPMDIVAVVCTSPHMAMALMLLLGNDSLMDIANRQDLYMALLKLLRIIATHHELLAVMVKPLDDCEEEDKPDKEKEEGGPSSSRPSRTVLSTMQTLHKQASVYVKTLNAVGQELKEDPGVVSMALTIIAEADAMQEALKAWRIACQQEADALAPALAAAHNASFSPAAAKEQSYLTDLQPLLFANAEILQGHFYAKQAASIKLGDGEHNRKRMLRLVQEISSLSTDLPLCWDTGVFLRVDENRPDVLRALIFPTPETPYAYGAFLFDILLGPSYPEKPPNVILLTTGNGRVRFNPNLYNCGKVCLSLLGTWSGPSWQPGVSTLLQVLLSIQSMIFVPDPYFNEPGHENTIATARGKQASDAYNASLHPATVQHAILPALLLQDKALKPFEDVIKLHYRHHRDEVKAQLTTWVKKYPAIKQSSHQIEQLLDKL